MSLFRLFRLLTLLAVLMSPVAMAGGAPARATAPAAAAADHCAGMDERSKPATNRPPHDCMMACAAILATGSEPEAARPASAPVEPVRPTGLGHGVNPEAATPPPRSS